MTKTISAADAAELYADGEGALGDTAGPWTLAGHAQEHPHRQSRWHQRHWLLLQDERGDTYGLDFGFGLTEYQEHDFPWDDAPDDRMLPLTRLYPHTVTTVKYRTKPAEETA